MQSRTQASAMRALLLSPLLLSLLLAPGPTARAQQFNGPNLRYPEHASEQEAAPWAGVVREQVEANAATKEGLARHHLYLIPNPPHPPTYAANGTQFGDLSREKVSCGFLWLEGLCMSATPRRLVAGRRVTDDDDDQ